MEKLKNFSTKFLCFSLIFAMLPWNSLYPTTVKADKTSGHDTYFIETLLEDSGVYTAQVHKDSNAFGKGIEETTMQKAGDDGAGNELYLDWRVYSAATIDGVTTAKKDVFLAGQKLPTSDKKIELTDETGYIFSFPSYQRKTGDSYMKDQDRAVTISSTLSKSLNSLIQTLKGNINYNVVSKDSTIDNKISDTIYISRLANPKIGGAQASIDDSNSNFTKVSIGNALVVYYAKPTNYDAYMSSHGAQKGLFPGKNFEVTTIDDQGNLLMYVLSPEENISKASDLNGCSQIWAMPKGYLNPSTGKAVSETENTNHWGLANSNSADNEGDAVWITIFSLAEYANAQAQYKGYTTTDASAGGTNMVEDWIYGIIMNVYSGLLNLLKLSTITELIYGQGMMSDSWWNQVLKYHLIFQILAWMMLIVAVAKILLQINFSTVNPTIRMSIMDTGQKLLIVGFSLALCIPFIRVLEELNNLIVNIFQTEAADETHVLSGLGIAGIVILLGYFSITFTMNCIYIMRSIMIGILTSSAPLFITSMAFSGPKQKGLMDNWLKEISANIFMQSIHAFAFAFLFDIMDSSNLMVRLVIYFSLLPIVDSFRQLVFGNAGNFAVNQGQKASRETLQFVESRAKGHLSGAANSSMKGATLQNQFPIDATAGAASSGGSTGGEAKAGKAIAETSNRVASIGTAIKENGGISGQGLFTNSNGLGKEGSKLNNATKAAASFINQHTQGGTKLNNLSQLAAQAGGSGMRGLSKVMDGIEASGGLSNNAVFLANIGDTHGSVEASKRHGEAVATSTQQNISDVATTAQNARRAHQEGSMISDASEIGDIYNMLTEDEKARAGQGGTALSGAERKNLQNRLDTLHRRQDKVISRYQKGRQSAVNFFNSGGHTHMNIAAGELTQNLDGSYNLSKDTFASWTAEQQAMSGINFSDFGDRTALNIGQGTRSSSSGNVAFFNFDQTIKNKTRGDDSFGPVNMDQRNQEKLDNQTKATSDARETASQPSPGPTANTLF